MFKGAEYICKGIAEFFHEPKLWKYSLIPFSLTLLLYGLLGWLCLHMIGSVNDYFREVCASWPDFLQWLASVMGYSVGVVMVTAFILIAIFTAGSLYELFGGPFFDRMIVNYERKKYGTLQNENRWGFEASSLVDALLYSLTSLLILIALFILGFVLPFIGTAISFVIMSYRFGVLYLAICNFRHGVKLHATAFWARRNLALTMSFGMIIQLIFWVPLLPLVLLPGVILGGVLLLRDNFNWQSSCPDSVPPCGNQLCKDGITVDTVCTPIRQLPPVQGKKDPAAGEVPEAGSDKKS